MFNNYKIAVIVVAGGSGKRLGANIPKQYLQIAGKTILEHSLNKFLNNRSIDFVQTVICEENIELFDRLKIDSPKMLPRVFGGKERQVSVLNGLKALQDRGVDKVLIHDAARCLVSDRLINNIIAEISSGSGVEALIPVVKVSDTIKKVNKKELISKTIKRDNLRRAQTPQAFDYGQILELHEKYQGEVYTDDANLFEKEKLDVNIIAGDKLNFKITDLQDYEEAKLIMEKDISTKHTRTGNGFDVHQFEDGDFVTICGVKVAHDKSLKGHSDADVGLHAITDAILGALAMGDIGEHFSDKDDRWKGCDSSVFLEKCLDFCRDKDAEIINIDVTIICEEPKLLGYKPAMKRRVAEILRISETQVNVKATTTEKLGFLGRSEGIAAQASANILM